jgi:NAD(P)H dehydrogenase (quinone)
MAVLFIGRSVCTEACWVKLLTADHDKSYSEEDRMPRVLVLYYSTYGHVEQLAQSAAKGASSVSGTEVVIKRVPELMPPDVAEKAGAKLDQVAEIAEPSELAEYDAILIGSPTRYGRMAAQMANFLDQTGSLWASGALVGKVGSAFTSTATQHGGQETTLLAIITNMLHFGMVIVGLPYAAAGQMRIDEITGGSPYGATTIAGGSGERQPSENELELIRWQGRFVAEVAAKQVST